MYFVNKNEAANFFNSYTGKGSVMFRSLMTIQKSQYPVDKETLNMETGSNDAIRHVHKFEEISGMKLNRTTVKVNGRKTTAYSF